VARVSRMDWEELRVRVLQEFRKRNDLLMYRMGLGYRAARLDANSIVRSGEFFVSGSKSLEPADLLRKHLPEEAAEILCEADEISNHRFRLLGYDNLDFASSLGNDSSADASFVNIDWHLDPVNGKRTPLDPWFKIPFLDFTAVGDHKVVWELNRHQHFVTLAKARLLSGDERYTRELIAQWRSWSAANPYPLGINWGSTLEVAFRSLSWIWIDQLLQSAAEYTGFRAELMSALAFHGRYIACYLSTYFSPNTHLLGEAVALFFLGTLYPQMPGAARWKESGWQIVLHEAERQVRPDGVYFEQSLYYHVYALDFFLYARLLADRNQVKIPAAFDAVLERMLRVVEGLAQAGPAEGFGDDDGGRVWNPRRNRTEQMTDPLALGAVMYLKAFSAARLTEESIWLFGKRAVEKLASQHAQSLPDLHSVAFPDGGLYVLADSGPYPQTMVVDGGPQGVGRSGHGHADALSLRLTMDGRRWLIDSGSGVYVSKDPADRNKFRGTRAHNTMCVDGVDQAVVDEPFSWTQIPTVHAENWVAGKSFTYFVGSHDGYTRLADPVVHRRHVLKIAGGLYLVRDMALGQSEHGLEIRWHFAPDVDVQVISAARVSATMTTAGPQLDLIVPEESIWQMEVSRTSVSPAYGAFQSAPLVESHARVVLPAETATILSSSRKAVSQVNESGIASQSHFTSLAQTAVQTYELDYPHETHGFFFALGDKTWTSGSWSSDARVLYCRTKEKKLVHLVAIGGSHLNWQGQPVLTMAGPCNFFEWHKHGAVMNATAGEFAVTALFEELTGEEPKGDSSARLNQISSSYAEKH
jgi:Heparinase II/III-like protein/Heparinase II/III N-terminus